MPLLFPFAHVLSQAALTILRLSIPFEKIRVHTSQDNPYSENVENAAYIYARIQPKWYDYT